MRVYMTGGGYKVQSQTRVVFYCDSIHRNIDVMVNFQTFSNVQAGDSVCFELSKIDLER